MRPDSGPLSGKVRPLAILTLETNMRLNAYDAEKRTAIRTDLSVPAERVLCKIGRLQGMTG
jgi:hypothetical protein